MAQDDKLAIIDDARTIAEEVPLTAEQKKRLEQFIEERLIDGVPIRVLGVAGLLLTKEGMRPRDQADAEVLRRLLARMG